MEGIDNGANNSKPRVLLVEPDEILSREYKKSLEEWGYDVVVSKGHLQALTVLDDFCIDMMVIRADATDIDGIELCRIVRRRQSEYGRQHVFLMLLGREEHRTQISEHNVDADDFLIEPFLKSELRWRLSSGLRAVKLQRRLNQFLQTDPETGLLSREGLNLYLLEEVNRVSRKRGHLSVLILTVEDVEKAEADFGRSWVNWLQDQIATSIRKSLRNYDRLSKLQEGVLCLVLSETPADGAAVVAKRLQKLAHGLARQNPALAELEFGLEVRSLTLRLETDYTGVRKGVELLWSWVDQSLLDKRKERFEAGSLTNDGIVFS